MVVTRIGVSKASKAAACTIACTWHRQCLTQPRVAALMPEASVTRAIATLCKFAKNPETGHCGTVRTLRESGAVHDPLLNCTMIVSCTEYHVIIAITVAAAAIVLAQLCTVTHYFLACRTLTPAF